MSGAAASSRCSAGGTREDDPADAAREPAGVSCPEDRVSEAAEPVDADAPARRFTVPFRLAPRDPPFRDRGERMQQRPRFAVSGLQQQRVEGAPVPSSPPPLELEGRAVKRVRVLRHPEPRREVAERKPRTGAIRPHFDPPSCDPRRALVVRLPDRRLLPEPEQGGGFDMSGRFLQDGGREGRGSGSEGGERAVTPCRHITGLAARGEQQHRKREPFARRPDPVRRSARAEILCHWGFGWSFPSPRPRRSRGSRDAGVPGRAAGQTFRPASWLAGRCAGKRSPSVATMSPITRGQSSVERRRNSRAAGYHGLGPGPGPQR
jgi:hypothetical protein